MAWSALYCASPPKPWTSALICRSLCLSFPMCRQHRFKSRSRSLLHPPKEGTPPSPEPEVVPPEPEPPKPIDEKQVTPPPVVTIPRSLVASWQSALAAHCDRFKRYPVDARERGEQGLPRVALTIDHEGHLLASHIVQSTGSPTLDQETLHMLA